MQIYSKFSSELKHGLCPLIQQKPNHFLFPVKPLHPSLYMQNQQITEVESHKHLEFTFQTI